MPLDTYQGIKTAITNWVKKSNLTDNLDDIMTAAQGRIYRDLRIRAMEEPLTGTTDANGRIQIPADYVQLKEAHLDSAPLQSLEKKDAVYVYRTFGSRSGIPAVIAQEGSEFIFGPAPNAEFTVKGTYYKRLPLLTNTNNTNWFTTNAPELLLYAGLSETEAFIKDDERLPIWIGKYAEIAAGVQRENDREEFDGSPFMSTPG